LHLRLPDDLDEYLTQSARATRRSKNELAAQMLEEARRVRQFPGIAFRGRDWQRRAFLLASGLDVWEAVSLAKDFPDRETLLAETAITPGDAALAEAYATRFSDEIDDALAANELTLAEIRERYPTIVALAVDL
jgi:hypothetical protein